MSEIDPNTIKLGDLFWAKVGSHPWWPCMIFYDPSGEDYSQDNKRFHVQFLGPIQERAWISANYLIPYEGRDSLDKRLKESIANPKSKLPKNKYELKIRETIREQWDESWKAADAVIKLSNEERVSKYGRLSDEAKRRVISEEQKEGLKNIIKNVPLSQEEEEEAFNYYVNEEIDLTPVDENFNSESLIVELKNQWKIMNISNKRKFLVNPLNMFRVKHTKGRSSILPVKTAKTSLAGKKSVKQSKPVATHNLEIHRLIVSPAQYRNQPVCQQCEVYSPLANQMLQCNGKCKQWYHPSCAKYKSLPNFDIHKPETFLCPNCVSGDYKCSICLKSSTEDDPLFSCEYSDCSKQYHKKCISDDVCAKVKLNGTKVIIERCSLHICNTCYRESSYPDYRQCLKEETSKRKPEAKGGFLSLSEDDDRLKSSEFLQCVRCPAVFHSGDLCTPAGSVELSLSHIVCPRHFSRTLAMDTVSYKTQNMPFCSFCLKGGGERINCQWCPISYHTNCIKLADPELKNNKIEDASLTCSRCLVWSEPRYSQLVWAKVSGFRWWPVEVIHPRNAPINILQMSHPEGAFPIHFPASGEYQWTCRSRVYPFELGLLFKPNMQILKTNTVEKAFAKALSVVPGIHSLYVNHVWNRGLPIYSITVSEMAKDELVLPSNLTDDIIIDTSSRHASGKGSPSKGASQQSSRHSSAKSSPSKNSQQHSNYELISVNIPSAKALDEYLNDSVRNFQADAVKCSCRLDKLSADCQIMGENACPNAAKLHECIAKINCPGEKSCPNRQFKTLNEAIEKRTPLTVFKTTNRGFGLRSLGKIEMNHLIIELVGEVITLQECHQRLSQAVNHEKTLLKTNERQPNYEDSRGDSMFVKLTKDLMIDFTVKSNLSRFINHSCEANLYAETWIVDGLPRLGLFADREIIQGEELTLNYMEVSLTSAKLMCAKSGLVMCLCGSDLCLGNIKANLPHLQQPVQQPQQANHQATPITPTNNSKLNEEKPKITSETIPSPSAANKALSAQRKNEKNPVNLLKIQPNPVDLIKEETPDNGSDEESNEDNVEAEKKSGNDLLDKWNLPQNIRCHEDFCYRCGDGGELMLCDKTGCFKSFHLTCLGLSGPPRGIWYCPWHYCDICGHASTKMCWKCPNSFCDEHSTQIRPDGMPRIVIDPVDSKRFKLAQDLLALKEAAIKDEKSEVTANSTATASSTSTQQTSSGTTITSATTSTVLAPSSASSNLGREDAERCISLACRWICSLHQVITPQPKTSKRPSLNDSKKETLKPQQPQVQPQQQASSTKRKRQYELDDEKDDEIHPEGRESKRQRTAPLPS